MRNINRERENRFVFGYPSFEITNESTYRRRLGRRRRFGLVSGHRFVDVGRVGGGGGCVGGKLWRTGREAIGRLRVLLTKVLAHIVHVKVSGRRHGQLLFGGRPLLAARQFLQVILKHGAVVEVVMVVMRMRRVRMLLVGEA